MADTQLIVIGGFLGAGKTTSILSMAKYLMKEGKRVGIVTNDQASGLVDTYFLKSSGMSVLEVTGGCFCCNIERFLEKIHELTNEEKPEVILAEPVGSCTDLIATIFKPIKKNFNSIVTLRPLSVVVDPKRIKRLMMEKNSSFHSEINYLFTKQLEEADVIVLNKIDTLSSDETDSIIKFINDKFKGTEVIGVSAVEGKNIERWANIIAGDRISAEKFLDVNYDIYADAESRLGWLNLSGMICCEKELDINSFIYEFMNAAKDKFENNGYEIAHLKAYVVNEKDWAKASVTSVDEEIYFNKRADADGDKWNIIVNARVDIAPENLQTHLKEALNEKMSDLKINIEQLSIQCFRPGRPTPKYRIHDNM
jgi:Ni2+-binding GTPase involved in maturation of urease and hydrogenase